MNTRQTNSQWEKETGEYYIHLMVLMLNIYCMIDSHVHNHFILCRVLKLYPKGYSREDDKWLSVFLHLADNGAPKADEKIFVQANLRVLDQHGSNHKAYQSIFSFPYFLLTKQQSIQSSR